MYTLFENSMGLAGRKLDLIKWISSLKDESLVTRIESIKSEKDDWWDHITNEEKADIELGLAQIKRGESIPHEQVIDRFSKYK